MKEVVNVNIGGQAFSIDQDAMQMLSRYLGDVRSRLTENPDETMEEIEGRIAEILREQLTSVYMAVTARMIQKATEQMGAPETFGPKLSYSFEEQTRTHDRRDFRSMTRPRDDRFLGGVCSGLARHFGVDTVLLRLIMLGMILLGGLSIWIYILLWIIIPSEK